ncbi:MAG TPA: GntR family transcriptional regulator [Brevibacterium senegalense]|uniref:GntR family transcriptional regulator n=1 Tax=Brevibacterium senegalense TaxID=1033736 RepID=A0A921MD90_9MICO|nr:GntR family transcriptional regulator [Brevibacterium senegalense]
MPTIELDPADPAPPYEQVRRGIIARIAAGSLLPGDRLPAIRALAGELGLAANTVARAYKELEADGLLTTRRGAGTRIAEGIDPADLPTASGLDPAVATFATEVVARAVDDGLPLDQLAAAVRDEVARVSDEG